MSNLKVAVIGGGAAGFFAAISCKEHNPDAEVHLLERSNKLLAKVKVSGGGRCNVTHACFNNADLIKHYPRGSKQLKKAFNQFSTRNTVDWFQDRGVDLKVEEDGRMFPVTDDSQTIVDTLVSTARESGVQIRKSSRVDTIAVQADGFELRVNEATEYYHKVIVATGGSPKVEGFDWLKALGHEVILPMPSLFTFNMPREKITKLMGLTVPNAMVRVVGSKLRQSGPLLITHWGMSGPAILKTSAWGARELFVTGYEFQIQVSWLGEITEDKLRSDLPRILIEAGNRQLKNKNPFLLPNRLWEYFLEKLDLKFEKKWSELSKKEINRIVNILLNDTYNVSGKTTFKEEFVTAGGIALSDIDFNTMQSRKCPGMYFAGEVMDVDGVTGGFNFQAAWTSGFIAGKLN